MKKSKPITPVEAGYIDSGAYQGGEEDSHIAGHAQRGSRECVVITKVQWEDLQKKAKEAWECLAEVRTGEDFECICHKAGKDLQGLFEAVETYEDEDEE